MPSVGDGIEGFGLALVIALLTTPVFRALAWRIGAPRAPAIWRAECIRRVALTSTIRRPIILAR